MRRREVEGWEKERDAAREGGEERGRGGVEKEGEEKEEVEGGRRMKERDQE